MAVVVQSVDRSQQPQLLRPQEVRTVEVPWYEDQVGSCAFSVPVACLAGTERGREGEFGYQYKAWGECTKRCLFRFCSCVWIILFSSLSMSAMQVLVQEKKVHYQQIVLTSKGPQHHTHLTSSFPTEAERSLFLVYLSLKNVPWIGLFWFKIWKISML